MWCFSAIPIHTFDPVFSPLPCLRGRGGKKRTGCTRVLVLLFAVLLLGCGTRPSEPATDPAADVPAGFPRTVTDSFGHSLTIPRRPMRVVSTAPSNTEVLFAVGAGPQVVGVTTYCNYPPEATNREKIGGFAPKAISAERLVGLRPDLVLTTGRIQQPLSESLRKLGLSVLSFDAQTLDDVIGNVRSIGEATGRTEEGDRLASSLQERFERVRKRFAELPPPERPTVLFLQEEEPLLVAGPRTFAGQMIDVAGGRNVFADLDRQFSRVSEEEVLKRNPAVILTWDHGDGEARRERLSRRAGWDQLDAVRNRRIVTIDEDVISRPGPRLFDGLEQLADLLHPPTAKGR